MIAYDIMAPFIVPDMVNAHYIKVEYCLGRSFYNRHEPVEELVQDLSSTINPISKVII